VTKKSTELNIEDRLIDSTVRIKTFVIQDSSVRPARNAFDKVRGNSMMDLSNQNESFTTGCVAWQAGIRLLKKGIKEHGQNNFPE